MKQSFFIPCTLPNLNDIIAAAKAGKRGYQPYALMKAKYDLLIQSAIRKAKLKAVVGPVELEICWREKHHRRDIDGIQAGSKFICDALVKAGIVGDDGWKHIRAIHHDFCVNQKAPGAYVTLVQRAFTSRGEMEPV